MLYESERIEPNNKLQVKCRPKFNIYVPYILIDMENTADAFPGMGWGN